MTGLVAGVRSRVSARCLVNQCRKEGCIMPLHSAPKVRLIIDFDVESSPLPPPRTRCDYLFIAEAGGNRRWVVPLELKKGRLGREIVKQLRAGARAAEKLVPQNERVDFLPVAVHGGGLSRKERETLRNRRNWVRFHGHFQPVTSIKCGAPLTKALRS